MATVQKGFIPTKPLYVKAVPLCSECYKRQAEYHGPLKNGQWAWICGPCVPGRIDQRFRNGNRVFAALSSTPTAVELTPVELVATGIMKRMIQCPVCKTSKEVPDDEFGTQECGSCRVYMRVERLFRQ